MRLLSLITLANVDVKSARPPMSEEAPLILESFWDKFNRRLREEGLKQQFQVVNGQYSYPVPRDAGEWEIFEKILNELVRRPSSE